VPRVVQAGGVGEGFLLEAGEIDPEPGSDIGFKHRVGEDEPPPDRHRTADALSDPRSAEKYPTVLRWRRSAHAEPNPTLPLRPEEYPDSPYVP